MPDIENQLLAALVELEQAARQPEASLLPRFAKIDELAAQLGPDADPVLRHFLARKSYEKARQHLAGQTALRGECGRPHQG
jgi:hypothetical protein